MRKAQLKQNNSPNVVTRRKYQKFHFRDKRLVEEMRRRCDGEKAPKGDQCQKGDSEKSMGKLLTLLKKRG